MYFEPYIDFISGRIAPIVPYVTETTKTSFILATIAKRKGVFVNGIDNIPVKLAKKLDDNLPTLRSFSAQSVMEYQSWISRRGHR